MERRLEMHVFPYIGERDVRLSARLGFLKVLRRIESRGTYSLAHRVRSICSRVLRYARQPVESARMSPPTCSGIDTSRLGAYGCYRGTRQDWRITTLD